MKKYINTFYKTFLFTSIPTLLLNLIIVRRYSTSLPYIRISISVFLLSIFVSLAIRIFKCEKGKGYINAVLGYIMIIPTLFIIRATYGTYLFKFTYTIYIIMVVIGFIYGIALIVASRKYKSEVAELNRLLLNKDTIEDEEDVK